MGTKVIGNVKVKVNSKLVKTVPGTVEYDAGGEERTGQIADDTFHYQAMPTPTTVDWEGVVTDNFDMKALNELQGGTVEILSDVPGQSRSLQNATRVGPPIKVTSGNGRYKVQVQGEPMALKAL